MSPLVQLEFGGRPVADGFGAIRAEVAEPTLVIDPIRLPSPVDQFVVLADRADLIAGEIAGNRPGSAPVMIQADCTGTALALAIAARTTGPVLVQLFNPEAVDHAHLSATFCELADKLGAGPEQSRARVAGWLARNHPPAELLVVLRAALIELAADFARGLGVPAEQAADFGLELVDRYTGWLNFLLASGAAPPAVPDCELESYQTRDCPLALELPGLRIHRYDGPAAALRCPELVAAAIRGLRVAVEADRR